MVVGLALSGKVDCGYTGTLTEYFDGYEKVSHNSPIKLSGVSRLDFDGGETEARQAFSNLAGTILMEEQVGEIMILYGYSKSINHYQMVHKYKVNIMIAVTAEGVSIGIPLLKGSY